MALLATQLPLNAAAVNAGYDIPHRSDLEEAASQTYLAGAVLVLSGGTLQEGGANPTGIVGISENKGQNLGSAGFYSSIESAAQGPLYVPALPMVIFEGNLAGTTAGDPDKTHSLALTDIGTAYGIAKSTTNKYWYVNFSDTTNKRVVVIGLKDAVGTVGGRVYFMFTLTAGNTIYA